MSFNVRYGKADDGENDWLPRRAMVIRTIRNFGPDLLATQEVLAEQLDYVRNQLPDYGVVAAGREDGKRQGEATAIFYRTDRFDLLAAEHFWLSQSPQSPGSISWGASQTRMVSYCRLRLQRPQRDLWFFNTHFDHRSETARVESARLLRRRIGQLAGSDPVVLGGDFNSTEEQSVYHMLLADEANGPTLIDSYRAAHPAHDGCELTRHGFRPQQRGSRIDWLLHSPHFETEQAAIVRSRFAGRFPSDHYPVTAIIRFNDRGSGK